jgi:hypothetical protein
MKREKIKITPELEQQLLFGSGWREVQKTYFEYDSYSIIFIMIYERLSDNKFFQTRQTVYLIDGPRFEDLKEVIRKEEQVWITYYE